MTEEVNSPEEGNTPAELSPVEQQALDSGWVPKEEFQGEEHKWVDAGEFLRRGELFKKIEDQSKQLKDVRLALNEMKKLQGQIREVEYKKALDALKQQKKAALLEGDADALLAVEDRIDLVKEEQEKHKAEPDQSNDAPETHPEFTAWVDQNSWYRDSKPMRAFADALGQDLAASGNNPAEVLRKVAIEVRKEFPNKFRNPNQDKPGAVESGKGRGVSSSTKFHLSDEERRVMNTFIRQGVMTEKEYISELQKVRG